MHDTSSSISVNNQSKCSHGKKAQLKPHVEQAGETSQIIPDILPNQLIRTKGKMSQISRKEWCAKKLPFCFRGFSTKIIMCFRSHYPANLCMYTLSQYSTIHTNKFVFTYTHSASVQFIESRKGEGGQYTRHTLAKKTSQLFLLAPRYILHTSMYIAVLNAHANAIKMSSPFSL